MMASKSPRNPRSPRKTSGRQSRSTPRQEAGGAATAGGMNFQAAVSAIAAVYLARARPLGWLDGLVDDVPISLLAETGGSGDDIQIRLRNGSIAEVQVKRGLRRGGRLWEPLMRLSRAIHAGMIGYGCLVVSPDSTRAIRAELARDIIRLGDGRSDRLSEFGQALVSQLTAADLPISAVCQRLRIVTVNALTTDDASVRAARAELGHLCKSESRVDDAWNRLYRDASELIELRGARSASSVIRVLQSAGVDIAEGPGGDLATILTKLTAWGFTASRSFGIFGAPKAPSIDDAWIPLKAAIRGDAKVAPQDLAEALKLYHDWEKRYPAREGKSIDAHTFGRFVHYVVVVAGPGMGKSTLLKKLARCYSGDGFPVLRVSIPRVAARMKHQGSSFAESLFALGLDGAGIEPAAAERAAIADWVLLCDGLDECGNDQDAIAQGLVQFVAGHPSSRVIVTT